MTEYQTPKSSNSEVHELRYRISQLEHLVVHNSLGSSVLNSSSLPSNSTLLQSSDGLLDRIAELESLLAASEHENSQLRKHAELLLVERNRTEVQLLEKLYLKDNEHKDLQHAHQLIQVKLTKAEKRVSTVEEYVNGLPSQEELNEVKEKLDQAQGENQVLSGKLERLGDKLAKSLRVNLLLEKEMEELRIKLEELKPLEEAQNAFLDGGELAPLDFREETMVKDFVLLQKAQLLRSAKIIAALKEKVSRLESEKVENLVEISKLNDFIASLEDKQNAAQLSLSSLKDKLTETETQRTILESDKADLQQRIAADASNLQQREDHIKSLIELLTEIDFSVRDVERLVDLGKSLAVGEDPCISTLLGFNEEFDSHVESLLSQNSKSNANFSSLAPDCANYDPADTEWTLSRLVKIRSVRKHIRELQSMVSDLYADVLGGKMEGCKVQ